MTQSPQTNRAIIAAAGARKTQEVIDRALADPGRRVLITTFTTENLAQIKSRIEARCGAVPDHVDLAGWYTFVLRDGVRPYQAVKFSKPFLIKSLNFVAERPQRIAKTKRSYFLDSNNDVWREAASDLAHTINQEAGGSVISRLERIYDDIYIDEVQDLAGWDLDLLDLLFASKIRVTVVGDPRQRTYSTNRSAKNKQFLGPGFVRWLDDRRDVCTQTTRSVSHRCNQPICDLASQLFPDLEPLVAAEEVCDGHHGVFELKGLEAVEYHATHRAQVLRWDKRANTFGLPAINIGVSKGSTYDHVMIITTRPMRKFLETRDPTVLSKPESMYVAVTRARHSVAFVV